MFDSKPGSGRKKFVNKNKKKDVMTPKIIVVPILKKVDETIVGIINKIEKGLSIPPVKNNKALNCIKSYKRNNDAKESFN